MSGLLDQFTKRRPIWKSVEVSGAATTATIWTPTSGKKIALTGLDIARVGGTTTTALIFFADNDYSNGVDERVILLALGSTSQISLRYPGLISSNNFLLRGVLGSGTRISVTASGFELD